MAGAGLEQKPKRPEKVTISTSVTRMALSSGEKCRSEGKSKDVQELRVGTILALSVTSGCIRQGVHFNIGPPAHPFG